MERQEQTPEVSRELIAPERLSPGDNFFAQPPFITLAENANIPEGAKVEFVYNLIHRAASIGDMSPGELSLHRWSILTSVLSPANKRKYNISSYSTQEIYTLFRKLQTELEKYPLWLEYVNEKFDAGLYKSDGAYFIPSTTKKIMNPPITYVFWFIERQKQKQAGLTYGISEVFPQQFGETDITQITLNSGKARENRRWKLTIGAEIAREKR